MEQLKISILRLQSACIMGNHAHSGSETRRWQDPHGHVKRILQQPRHRSRHEPAQRSTKAAPLVLR